MYDVFERYNEFHRATFYGILNGNMNQLFLKDFLIICFHSVASKICIPKYFTTRTAPKVWNIKRKTGSF